MVKKKRISKIRKKIRPGPIIFLVALIALLVFLRATENYQQPVFETGKCVTNADCSWTSTNGCPENAGASWSCLNPKSIAETHDLVLCPQVISPKPQANCVCEQGSCVAK